MRENYFKKDEIFTLEIPTRKYKKPKMRENAKEIDINWSPYYTRDLLIAASLKSIFCATVHISY